MMPCGSHLANSEYNPYSFTTCRILKIFLSFNQDVDSLLSERANQQEDEIARKIVDSLEEQLQANDGLWKEIQERETTLQKARENLQEVRAGPVLHLQDQFLRDVLEQKTEALAFKGPFPSEHSHALEMLKRSVEEVLEKGFGSYPRIITIPVRVGHSRVIDVASYVTHLGKLLETSSK